MHRKSVSPKNIESPFNPDEMFFSITDLKGIILSGNDVFVRVSKYSRDELVGSPHNIIRHPDMPRIVFKLLWDYIQSGRPIAAYVKNMAKDGSYYWVLATVMPVKDKNGKNLRYLSIRIKPTTEYLPLVAKLYRELLEAEKKGGMEASYEKLVEALKSLGYDNYDSFMKEILSKEVLSKKDILTVEKVEKIKEKSGFYSIMDRIFTYARELNRLYDEIYKKIDVFDEFASLLKKRSDTIFGLTGHIRLISLNSSVESFKLGSEGAAFSVMSAEMRKNSELGNKIIGQMKEKIQEIMSDIEKMIVLINISKLQVIMLTRFLREILDNLEEENSDSSEKQLESDIRDILNLLVYNAEDIMLISKNVHRRLREIDESMKRVKILIKRLEFLYLNGMVEAAHNTRSNFAIIFSEVNRLVESTREVLTSIFAPLYEVLHKNKVMAEEFERVNRLIEEIYSQLDSIVHT
ncbi:methyl-accepting chemotaxis protein [Persephonella sp.]